MATKDPYNSLRNKIMFQKYKTRKILGKGSFGCVFQGINMKTNKMVAIKVQPKKSDSNLLEIETYFLSLLKGYGIPKLIGYGKHGNFYVMIQEILGLNLMQIKDLINYFTLKDLAMMGIQMMDRIEFIHSKYIIHRDIKPENFTTGFEDISTIYLIDFGISRKYRSSRTLKHVKFDLTGRMFGTVRYASYNASRGIEQSRRDDLESIANMLIYMYTGKLPWKGISLKDKKSKKKYFDMLALKKYLSAERICAGMPKEFIEFYKYCRKLNFEQDPDYEYLRNLFRKILLGCLEINDYKFSWISNNNYLKTILKTYGFKINIKDIKKEKYINKFKRVNSPGNRLYHVIKNSLEKNEFDRYKKSVGNSENILTHNNINSNLDLDSVKTFYRNASEDVIQIDERNDISENQNNLNKSKVDFTYKSEISQYNMNVDEFQDETKLYEQNKTMINIIQNNKNNSNINFIESQSYNFKSENKSSSNNKININQILNNFKMNVDIKDKLNLSMDLGYNYNKNFKSNDKKDNNELSNKNINNKINSIKSSIKNNYYIKRPKSQDIKNNFIKIINLSDKETEIKKNQEQLYNYIFNKIKKYVNKLLEKQLYQNNNNLNSNKYIKEYIKSNTEKNINNEINSSNFSFGKLNVGKNIGNNLSYKIYNQNLQRLNNTTKSNLSKNSYENRIKITKAINNANINNNIRIKRDNNIILNKNNIPKKDRRINIIINTNVNSFGKLSPKNKNNKNVSLINRTNPSLDKGKMNQINMNKQKKSTNNNNNFYTKEIRSNNFMKQIHNKNNIIIIPKQKRILMNKSKNSIFHNNRNYKPYSFTDNKYFSLINNMNFSMNNNYKNLTNKSNLNNNNKISSKKNRRTFEYKSILNKIKNSAQKYSSQKINDNNNVKINLINTGLKKLKKNNSYDSIPSLINIPNKFNHISFSNLNKNINNAQYYNLYPKNSPFTFVKNNKIRNKHYSPTNSNKMQNNKYRNLYSQNDFFFDKIINNRNNSDSKGKRILNYNIINLNENENTGGSTRKPMNLNNLNTFNFNKTEKKCFNFIKI